MSKKIKVKIGLDGIPQIAVEGVKGQSCKEVTKGLEKALGKVIKDMPTKEMDEREVDANVDARR